jgi:hypothetical protein
MAVKVVLKKKNQSSNGYLGRLIEASQEGTITYQVLNEIIPDEEKDLEKLEEMFDLLCLNNIEVIDGPRFVTISREKVLKELAEKKGLVEKGPEGLRQWFLMLEVILTQRRLLPPICEKWEDSSFLLLRRSTNSAALSEMALMGLLRLSWNTLRICLQWRP